MTPVTSLETVQRLLGYRFTSPRLLEEALTHKSFSNERRTKDRQQNERLDGGLDASRAFTLRVLGEELELVGTQGGRLGSDDYKTRLQEICQKRFDTLPRYATVR